MKKYKAIRNGTLVLIIASMVLISLFPIVSATSGSASFQESSAAVGDTIHADFTWTDAVWNAAVGFYAVMWILDPEGTTYDNEAPGTSSGSDTLSCVTDKSGIWTARIDIWDGSTWLTYTDTVTVGASGTASFQESSAAVGDTIHADFTWTDAVWNAAVGFYAVMWILDPEGTTYDNEAPGTSSGSDTLSCVTDKSGTWTARIDIWDGSSWLTYTDTLSVSGAGNQNPVADIDWYEPVGLTVDFTAAFSYDPDGTITTYQWDFTNDGSWDVVDTGTEVSYTYPVPGPYTCKLRVFDNDGGWDDATGSFTLSGGGTNEDPVASFTYSTSGLTVNVDGSGSSDPDGTIVGYQWDWTTDGSYDNTGETQSHTYSANGTYNITLRVMDNGSATNTTVHQVTVTTGGSTPGSGFATDNTMTYLIIGVVAAIAIGAVIYFGPTMKKGGRKKK